jgi:hypothetical protein
MSALRRLQQDFQQYIFRAHEAMQTEIVETTRVDGKTRLGIYASAYRLRLLEALATEYPALKALVGDDVFEQAGLAYIEAHPSPYYNLRWYGGEFAAFLKTIAPFCDFPVTSELAAFEWAMGLAFDAPDDVTVSIETVAAISSEAWPRMRFIPHGSLQRLDMLWNAPAIWRAVENEQDPESPMASGYPVAWALWRQDLKTYFRSLSVDEAWALDAARNGATFAEICAGLCEWIDAAHVAPHAAGLLKVWVHDGLIKAITLVP